MGFVIHTDHTDKIIYYSHTGLISNEDIGGAWTEFLKMKEFTELKYNLLSDYSEAKFDLGTSDLQPIIDFLANLREILRNKKQALVILDPHSTALSLLFESEAIEQVGFIVRVFSTKAAAIKWLTA